MGKKATDELEEETTLNDGEGEEEREEGEEEEEEEEEEGEGSGEEEEEEEEEEADRGDGLPEDDEDGLRKVAGDDEGGGRKGSGVVSHGRFNKVNEAYKSERAERLRLEEELARVRGGSKPADDGKKKAAEFDFDAKEAEYLEAVSEGETDKAKAIRREINAEFRKQSVAEATAAAKQAVSQQAAQTAFAEAVADVTEQYPFLDSKSKVKNDRAISLVVATRNQYIADGKTPAQALRMAAKDVGPLFVKKNLKAADADDGEEEEEKGQRSKMDELRARRLKRNAAAANNQPPPSKGGVGDRGDKTRFDAGSASDEEFRSLPAAERKRLRGDAL